MQDLIRDQISPIGQITQPELEYLKAELLAQLHNSTVLEDAIMSLMSEPKYPDNIPEAEEIGTGDLEDALDQGYQLILEPASRLLYTEEDSELLFWANGEGLYISDEFAPLLKQIADGELVELNEDLYHEDILEDVAQLLNDSVLMLLPAEDAEDEAE